MSNTDNEFFRYVPVSPSDRRWGIYVTGGGWMNIPPGGNYPPHVHPDDYQFTWPQRRVLSEFQAVYIAQGAGEFESQAAGTRKIAGGNLILTFPNDWHRYRPDPNIGWNEYWIGFDGEVAHRLVANRFLSERTPVLPVQLNQTILHHFVSALDRLRAEPPGMQQLVAADVLAILGAALAAKRMGRADSTKEELIRKAKVLLSQSGGAPLTVDEVAETLSLSTAQFRRVFKQYVGMPPYQYYCEMRLSRAKELLAESTMTVKDVAMALHFESQYHFSNVFKKKFGMAPDHWRRGGTK